MVDYAEPFRTDVAGGMLIDVIVVGLRKHITNLEALPEATPERDRALSDCRAYLAEIEVKANEADPST